ncbi:GntR family transcriptional regulator [Cryobacterium sp. SO2]|uniref:GntR family transcriptional regulator n=1 Tax=Cryobacterium sp. SO2 TaxID=1897060 RepID=UPI00223C938D|nr:GntR family transcriptional regulator [Cryobacterium sp. SO2]WEO78446.1 GntR family transcriptional regulator [Cryobacterium sp. SO2]
MSDIAVLPAASATVRAADSVRRLITSGRLAPGSRLIESRLAADLGVSRSPLREALRVLEEEGLLSSVPNHGVTVTELSAQDVYEIYTLRRTLEEMAVRIGVPVTDPARLERLDGAFAQMLENAHNGDEDSAAEDSHRFHLALVGLAGHSRLEHSYRSLALQLTMHLNRRARAASETLVERAERHRRVLDLVRAGDAEAVITELADGAAVTLVRRLGGPGLLTPEAERWYLAALAHD